jgi:hypothetical protein
MLIAYEEIPGWQVFAGGRFLPTSPAVQITTRGDIGEHPRRGGAEVFVSGEIARWR